MLDRNNQAAIYWLREWSGAIPAILMPISCCGRAQGSSSEVEAGTSENRPPVISVRRAGTTGAREVPGPEGPERLSEEPSRGGSASTRRRHPRAISASCDVPSRSRPAVVDEGR
jgi:hypothetical protein